MLKRHHVLLGSGIALVGVGYAAIQAVPPAVEAQVQSSVEDALVRRGMTWAGVEVDGRQVVLAGDPGGEQQRRAALVVAREVPGVLTVTSALRMAGEPSPDEAPPADGSTLSANDPSESDGPGEVEQDGRAQNLPERQLASESEAPAPAERVGSSSGGDSLEEETSSDGGVEVVSSEDDRGAEAGQTSPPVDADEPTTADEVRPSPVESEAADQTASSPPPATPTNRPTGSCETRVLRIAHEKILFFETGSSELSPVDAAEVEEIGQTLRGCREWTLTVVGYAGENEGEAGWRIAEARARAVARILVRAGVDETRIAAVGGRHDSSTDLLERRVEIFASGG